MIQNGTAQLNWFTRTQ